MCARVCVKWSFERSNRPVTRVPWTRGDAGVGCEVAHVFYFKTCSGNFRVSPTSGDITPSRDRSRPFKSCMTIGVEGRVVSEVLRFDPEPSHVLASSSKPPCSRPHGLEVPLIAI